jgi:hypothetical protein
VGGLPQPSWRSLRCRLGWHAPLKGALWNQGYYFSRCGRCGVDLVRTTYSGWEAPRGQRVVWGARPETGQSDARPNLPAPPTATSTRPAPKPARASTRAPSVIPDFMDDPAEPPPPKRADEPVRSPGGGRARS